MSTQTMSVAARRRGKLRRRLVLVGCFSIVIALAVPMLAHAEGPLHGPTSDLPAKGMVQ